MNYFKAVFIKTLAALRAPPVALTNCFTFASLATPNAVETTTQLIEAMHPGRSLVYFTILSITPALTVKASELEADQASQNNSFSELSEDSMVQLFTCDEERF